MALRFSHLLVLATLLVVVGCSPFENSMSGTPTPMPTLASAAKATYTVKRGELLTQLQFSARVSPALEQSLSFRQSGRVNKVRVQPNMNVKANELLAELDTETSQYEIRRAQIAVEEARINLDIAKAQPDSATRDLEIKLQERKVELAELSLQQLTGVITDTQIFAPFDGRVVAVRIAEGKSIQAFDEAILIADMSQLDLRAEPSASDLKQLKEEMPVEVVFDKRPNEPLPGHIAHLPFPYGSGDSAGGKGGDDATRIVLESAAEQAALALSQSAQIKVVLAHKTDILWLPPQAIRTFQGRQFVVVQTEAGQRRVDVKLGLQNDDKVEVVDGLTEGQIVIGP